MVIVRARQFAGISRPHFFINWRLLAALLSTMVPLHALEAGMVSVPPDVSAWQYVAGGGLGTTTCAAMTGIHNNQPPETTGIYSYQACRSGGNYVSGESCAIEETKDIRQLMGPSCPRPVFRLTSDWVAPNGSGFNICSGTTFSPPLTMGIETFNLKFYTLDWYQTWYLSDGTKGCRGAYGSLAPITEKMLVYRTRTVKCPDGTYASPNPNQCSRQSGAVNPDKTGGPAGCDKARGNPCDAATGNKFETETDYLGSGNFPLVFRRSYNSLGYDKAANAASRVGRYWRASYLGAITGMSPPTPTGRRRRSRRSPPIPAPAGRPGS